MPERLDRPPAAGRRRHRKHSRSNAGGGLSYPVHINHVADGLEGKEGNADRQKYIQRLIGNVLQRGIP